MQTITKEDLKIPESLDKWYKDHGWFEDYWMELPPDWQEWSDEQLKKYPIVSEIINWRKSCKRKN